MLKWRSNITYSFAIHHGKAAYLSQITYHVSPWVFFASPPKATPPSNKVNKALLRETNG